MKFKVWCPERGQTVDDAAVFVTRSAVVAAEVWAEKADEYSVEYEIVGGATARVCVKDPDGIVTWWSVTGENVPQYYAREVEGAHDGA